MKKRWQIKCECRRRARALADALMQLRDVNGGGNTATLDIFEYDGCKVCIQAIAGCPDMNDSAEVE